MTVKTYHVSNVLEREMRQILFHMSNSGKILNHHVVAIQLRVLINVILDMKDFFMIEDQSAILLVSISAQLSNMPTWSVIASHVIHVCPVKAVQLLQPNFCKVPNQTVNVSQLKATLHVTPSTVACGNMTKKATTATKMKNLSTC